MSIAGLPKRRVVAERRSRSATTRLSLGTGAKPCFQSSPENLNVSGLEYIFLLYLCMNTTLMAHKFLNFISFLILEKNSIPSRWDGVSLFIQFIATCQNCTFS